MTPQEIRVSLGANGSVSAPVAVTANPVVGMRRPGDPSGYNYQEYPKDLFGPDGQVQTIQNPDQEQVLLSRGWSETPKPVLLKPSPTLAMQASTDSGLKESYALLKTQHDQNIKMFNERYGAKSMECDQLKADLATLQKQFNDISARHSALVEDHSKLLSEQPTKFEGDISKEKGAPRGVPFKKPEKPEEKSEVATSV